MMRLTEAEKDILKNYFNLTIQKVFEASVALIEGNSVKAAQYEANAKYFARRFEETLENL